VGPNELLRNTLRLPQKDNESIRSLCELHLKSMVRNPHVNISAVSFLTGKKHKWG
jgi:hypothetical protein